MNNEEIYEKAIKRYFDTLEKYEPTRVSSQFISCRNCGSKLNREVVQKEFGYVHTRLHCPVCKSALGLYSRTAIKAIDAAYVNMEKQRAKQREDKKKKSEKTNSDTVFTEALEETRNRFDYIYEENKTPDFVEIVGNMGGDSCTFRVYNDGSVYER